MLTSRLAYGPLSHEIVEAIFRYSHLKKREIMLICSRNQIDYNHGYVCHTNKLSDWVRQYKILYPLSGVKICRDHCGPHFGNPDNSFESIKDTICCDIENNFDLIHIDLCHFPGSHDTRLKKSSELILFGQDLNRDILFEIGTDENVGIAETNVDRVGKDIEYFLNFCLPNFYVVQTGSLVKEMKNVGEFCEQNMKPIADVLREKDVKIKEHNADYLSGRQILRRCGIIDAMNVAPQLGVVQTLCVISSAVRYGVDACDFMNFVYKSNQWRKWILPGNEIDKTLCVFVAGHYHYNSSLYARLYHQLEKVCSIRENIISDIMSVMVHYGRYFYEDGL